MAHAEISKAGKDALSDLVGAVGIKDAWSRVKSADAAVIPEERKSALLTTMASEHLSKTSEALAKDGLTPGLLDMLSLLVELLRGQPTGEPDPAATTAASAAPAPQDATAKAGTDARVTKAVSFDQISTAVREALETKIPKPTEETDGCCSGIWICEMYDDSCIFNGYDSKLYQVSYTFDGISTAQITGDPVEVVRTYVPAAQAAAAAQEAAAGASGSTAEVDAAEKAAAIAKAAGAAPAWEHTEDDFNAGLAVGRLRVQPRPASFGERHSARRAEIAARPKA